MTNKRIGPNFGQELAMAGLLGLPFTWGDDGVITFGDGMTEEQIAAVRAVYAAHDPDSITAKTIANTAAIQAKMDKVAQSRGYDHIISACSYAAQPNPFQAEGIAFLNWRSAVWQQAYLTLADVEAGKVPMPTPEEAVAAMPPFTE